METIKTAFFWKFTDSKNDPSIVFLYLTYIEHIFDIFRTYFWHVLDIERTCFQHIHYRMHKKCTDTVQIVFPLKKSVFFYKTILNLDQFFSIESLKNAHTIRNHKVAIKDMFFNVLYFLCIWNILQNLLYSALLLKKLRYILLRNIPQNESI